MIESKKCRDKMIVTGCKRELKPKEKREKEAIKKLPDCVSRREPYPDVYVSKRD